MIPAWLTKNHVSRSWTMNSAISTQSTTTSMKFMPRGLACSATCTCTGQLLSGLTMLDASLNELSLNRGVCDVLQKCPPRHCQEHLEASAIRMGSFMLCQHVGLPANMGPCVRTHAECILRSQALTSSSGVQESKCGGAHDCGCACGGRSCVQARGCH